MSKVNKGEFTSAGVDIPFKLLANEKSFEMLTSGDLKPMHLQIYPTNECNLSCSFCLCDDRNRGDLIPFKYIKNFIEKFEDTLVGVTIAGGGEPMTYPSLVEFIDLVHGKGIEVGLTTNGTLIGKKAFTNDFFSKLTWLRISVSEYAIERNLFKLLDMYPEKFENCDLGFNWVCTEDYELDVERIKKCIDSYNDMVEYIKIADDAFYDEPRAQRLYERLELDGYDISKVVLGHYSKPGIPDKICKIWKIRPVITADGNVYPCCGLPYVWNEKSGKRDFPEEAILGNIMEENYEKLFDNEYFDGTACGTCFYTGYNKLIAGMETTPRHLNFL